MTCYIIDTNVLITANEGAPQASEKNVMDCKRFLINVQSAHKVCVDSRNMIFSEYFGHVSRSGQPNVGDAFTKWLWDNQYNNKYCEIVEIVADDVDPTNFKEFPINDDLKSFDRSDRKFVAVALKSKLKPIICNATDTDWWIFRNALELCGVKIEFLCPELMI